MKCEFCDLDVVEFNYSNIPISQELGFLRLMIHQNQHIIDLLAKIEARQDRLEKSRPI